MLKHRIKHLKASLPEFQLVSEQAPYLLWVRSREDTFWLMNKEWGIWFFLFIHLLLRGSFIF